MAVLGYRRSEPSRADGARLDALRADCRESVSDFTARSAAGAFPLRKPSVDIALQIGV